MENSLLHKSLKSFSLRIVKEELLVQRVCLCVCVCVCNCINSYNITRLPSRTLCWLILVYECVSHYIFVHNMVLTLESKPCFNLHKDFFSLNVSDKSVFLIYCKLLEGKEYISYLTCHKSLSECSINTCQLALHI